MILKNQKQVMKKARLIQKDKKNKWNTMHHKYTHINTTWQAT